MQYRIFYLSSTSKYIIDWYVINKFSHQGWYHSELYRGIYLAWPGLFFFVIRIAWLYTIYIIFIHRCQPYSGSTPTNAIVNKPSQSLASWFTRISINLLIWRTVRRKILLFPSSNRLGSFVISTFLYYLSFGVFMVLAKCRRSFIKVLGGWPIWIGI